MSELTFSYTLVPLRSRVSTHTPKSPKPPRSRNTPRRGDRTARLLALAHRIEQMVEQGDLADYADAAARLGLSRARLSQVVALANLASDIQEQLLLGTLIIHERRLRAALRSADWNEQRAALQGA